MRDVIVLGQLEALHGAVLETKWFADCKAGNRIAPGNCATNEWAVQKD
jgi:hypothetical protein